MCGQSARLLWLLAEVVDVAGVCRTESRVFFTSGSAVEEEEEEETSAAAACAVSLQREVAGSRSSTVVLPCTSSAVRTSRASDTDDSLGQHLCLVL